MARKRIVVALFAALFLDLLGFGMIIADIQLNAERLLPAAVHDNRLKGLIIGGVLASTFVVQLFFSSRWGRLSDRVGRKPILLICSLISALSMFVYGAADSIPWLLASRVIGGIGAANVAIAHALVADLFDGEDRKKAMARTGASVSAGLIAGPALGGRISEHLGSHTLGYIAGGASAIGLLILAFTIPNAEPRTEEQLESKKRGSFSLLLELPELRRFVIVALIAWFALATLEGTFARLIHKLYGYGPAEFGNLFAFESAITVLVQATVLAIWMKSLGETTLLRLAYLGQGIGLAMIPFSGNLGATPILWLFVSSTAYGLGAAIAGPTINALCSHLTPSERQGELFGLIQSTRAIGFIVGPMLGGVLFGVSPALPYVFAGIVCVLAMVVVQSRQPSPAT